MKHVDLHLHNNRKICLLTLLLLINLNVMSQIFGEHQFITNGSNSPSVAAVFDHDQDGDLDIFVAFSSPGTLSLFENIGNGQFTRQRILNSQQIKVNQLIVADLDSDGLNDLLFCARHSHFIGWMKNSGDGTFMPTISLLDIEDPRDIAAGDIDADGDNDLVYSSGSGVIQIMNNIGDATFEQLTSNFYTSTLNPGQHYVRLVDMDGDTDLDIISLRGVELIWFENDGTGNYIEIHEYLLDEELESIFDFEIEDVDSDGDPDLIFGTAQGVYWMVNDGLGSLEAEVSLSVTSNPIRSMELSDIDNDGDLDMWLDFLGENVVQWQVNMGGGTFQLGQELDTLESWINFPFVGDIDGDEFEDLILLNSVEGKVLTYHNVDGQNFSAPVKINSSSDNVCQVEAIDIDNDGDLDLISASKGADNIGFHENLGGLVFANAYMINPSGMAITSINLGDIDGDGDIDLLSSSDTGDNGWIHWYPQVDGFFLDEGLVIPTSSGFVSSAILGDVDMDGDLDIVASISNGNTQILIKNQGDGTFDTEIVIGTSHLCSECMDLYDIDNDMDLDIVMANSLDWIKWLENDGSGEFLNEHLITTQQWGTRDIELADIDNDGDVDVIAATQYLDQDVQLYLNQGDEIFSEGIGLYSTGTTLLVSRVSTADLDLDGDLDILFSYPNETSIYYVENLGPAFFGDPVIISDEIANPTDLLSVDLDGDNYPELVVTHLTYWGDISIYSNTLGQGCTDPTACNYNPNAVTDDGSCCFDDCGCMVQSANNFNPSAECDDGSCIFNVMGSVFFDENENGVKDSTEILLAGQEVLVDPGNLTLTTNSSGEFLMQAESFSTYSFSVITDDQFPFVTTPQPQFFNSSANNWNEQVAIGISNEFADSIIHVNQYIEGQTFLCNAPRRFNICINNEGTIPLNGYLSFNYDTLYQGFIEITEIDSIIFDDLIYEYENLIPGEVRCIEVELITPTVQFIGSELISVAVVYVNIDGVDLPFDQNTLISTNLCAYDPNDKQAFPIGYSDSHYVHPDSTLEYLIRFQNTGNAPATDVRIIDILDEGFDTNTFQFVASSHPVFSSVNHDTKMVEFYFPNIMLPDSVNNEPESHGFVSFSITPANNLPLLTELNNKAQIYFDNNPPIITNTTWSTLYDCTLFTVEFYDSGAILTASQGDNYQWFLDGDLILGATGQEHVALQDGDYSVEINTDFPCSSITNSIYIAVNTISEYEAEILTLFPNPMTRSAILKVGDFSGSCELRLIDVSGRIVRQRELRIDNGEVKVERGELKSGIYLLELSKESKHAKIKFIVQ